MREGVIKQVYPKDRLAIQILLIMETWLEPKDLQHNFEVEKLMNEFVKRAGGKLVSELISASPDFENADYVFKEENVLIELKCLQTDFPQSNSFGKKIIDLYKQWLVKQEVTLNMLFDTSKLPRNKRIYLNKLYAEPLRRIIKKANRQLRSTEQRLLLSDTKKLLIMVNDGLYSFEPPLLISMICNILQREFSSIDGFVYMTVNRYVEVPGDAYARQLWIPVYSDKAIDSLPEFVNFIGKKWGEFFAEKIGGFYDTYQTERFDDLINVKNIRA